MDRLLEESLLHRFKWLQARNVWTGKKLNFCMPCSHGDGWYQLIYDLCEAIENHYKKNNANPKTIRVDQIKEKWGMLSFYIGNVIDGTYEIVHEYKKKSATICESCGAKGTTKHRGSWLRTLCDKCGKEQGYVDFNDEEV